MNDNPCVPTGCKGDCLYDARNDRCESCGRTMEEIRYANTVRRQLKRKSLNE